MRFWATTRKPAVSSRSMILPVRLRRVASGLMMESVRSVAMAASPVAVETADVKAVEGIAAPYNGGTASRQPQRRFQGLESRCGGCYHWRHVADQQSPLPGRRTGALPPRLGHDQPRLARRPGRA